MSRRLVLAVAAMCAGPALAGCVGDPRPDVVAVAAPSPGPGAAAGGDGFIPLDDGRSKVADAGPAADASPRPSVDVASKADASEGRRQRSVSGSAW